MGSAIRFQPPAGLTPRRKKDYQEVLNTLPTLRRANSSYSAFIGEHICYFPPCPDRFVLYHPSPEAILFALALERRAGFSADFSDFWWFFERPGVFEQLQQQLVLLGASAGDLAELHSRLLPPPQESRRLSWRKALQPKRRTPHNKDTP